jgi:hypothetical protein
VHCCTGTFSSGPGLPFRSILRTVGSDREIKAQWAVGKMSILVSTLVMVINTNWNLGSW